MSAIIESWMFTRSLLGWIENLVLSSTWGEKAGFFKRPECCFDYFFLFPPFKISCCFCHQMDKNNYFKRIWVEWVWHLWWWWWWWLHHVGVSHSFISFWGVCARLSPGPGSSRREAAGWKEARMQWEGRPRCQTEGMTPRNQRNQGGLRVVVRLGCVISAFPSRGNRRVRSRLSGAVKRWAERCRTLQHFSSQTGKHFIVFRSTS